MVWVRTLARPSKILKHIGRQKKIVRVIIWTLGTPGRSCQEPSTEYEHCGSSGNKDTLIAFLWEKAVFRSRG